MADSAPGFVDTNVFIHANANDPLSEECRMFLGELARGRVQARLEPLVLHELTYALPRYLKVSRADLGDYLLLILGWPGIHGPIDEMRDAVRRWASTPGLGFVDAYLAVLATRDDRPVYTKNIRDFAGQGVVTPNPLPSAANE